MDGDGTLVYPGTEGMISSIRLEAITDGIEDWQLFDKLGATSSYISNGADLISQLVRNMSDYHLDSVNMEKVRRLAARRVIEQMRHDHEPQLVQ